RTFDGVGRIKMRIAGERITLPQQEVAGRCVAAVTQVQRHMFGQRANAVGVCDVVDEFEYPLDDVRFEARPSLESRLADGHHRNLMPLCRPARRSWPA